MMVFFFPGISRGGFYWRCCSHDGAARIGRPRPNAHQRFRANLSHIFYDDASDLFLVPRALFHPPAEPAPVPVL